MLLPEAHLPLGGRFGDAGGFQAVLDYAPLDQEARLLEAVGISDGGFHGVLSIRGEAGERMLQNLLTNDLAALREGHAQPSLLLTAKGRVLGIFRVWRHNAEHVDLLVEAPCMASAKEGLERYGRVGKVAIEDRSRELGVLFAQGPKAGEAVAEALDCDPPKPGGVVETAAGNVLGHASLASAQGYVLIVRQEQALDAWQRLVGAARNRGGGPVGWHTIDAARVRAGIPRFGTEATLESLPGEAGLDDAISYNKGCFVGQEVVARIHNLGHVNRLAVRLAPEPACEVGDALMAQGKEVGRVTSVARGPGPPAALGVVRREVAADATLLSTERGPAKVQALARLL